MRPIRTTLNPESLKLIGIPRELRDKSLEDFCTYSSGELVKVKDFFTDYLNNLDEQFYMNVGVYLYGSNGTGKTFLASMIAREAYRKRYSTRRTTFVEYLSAYTEAWGARSTEERESKEEHFYSYYKAVEFLILEEVGKEIDSKIAAPILEDCLRYREDHGLVTIICTNLELETMQEKYGASIFSLLKGNMLPICITGTDKRAEYFEKRRLELC
jgi:DNA replication protein DnaC